MLNFQRLTALIAAKGIQNDALSIGTTQGLGKIQARRTSSITSSSSSSSTESRTSEQSEDEHRVQSTVMDILDEVTAIISRLQRVSTAIRKALRRRRNEKILNSELEDPGHIALYKHLEDRTTWILSNWFPQSDENTRQKLLAAILLRQKRFLYMKSRRAKPSILEVSSMNPPQAINTSIPNQPTQPKQGLPKSDLVIVAPEPEAEQVESRTAPTMATGTTFNEKLFSMDDPRPARSVRSQNQDKVLDWPLPPKIPPGSSEYECPYCFDLLTKDELAGELWRFVTHFS
jgi:hypothetical protein